MKITNEARIHEAVVVAVEMQDEKWYSGVGEDRFASVTELPGAAYRVVLMRRHQHELTEEAVDCLWRLRGAACHKVLEDLLQLHRRAIVEKRLGLDVDGKRITGGIDLIWDWHELVDFKDTSAWHIVFGQKRDKLFEYQAQANSYAEMARQAGYPIDKINVVAFLRDWQVKEALANPDYPRAKCVTIPMPLWEPEDVLRWLHERVRLLDQALQADLADILPCTPEECWEQPSKWALHKKGQKRAQRVYKSQAEAQAALGKAQTAQKGKSRKADAHYIETRPGGRRRCEQYCAAAALCPAYQKYLSAQGAKLEGGA